MKQEIRKAKNTEGPKDMHKSIYEKDIEDLKKPLNERVA